MGLLGTRWEAEYEGHKLVVTRNELTKGFALEWDGREIARRRWSLVGLGELEGSAETAEGPAQVRAVLYWGGVAGGWNGKCLITINGKEIEVRLVR